MHYTSFKVIYDGYLGNIRNVSSHLKCRTIFFSTLTKTACCTECSWSDKTRYQLLKTKRRRDTLRLPPLRKFFYTCWYRVPPCIICSSVVFWLPLVLCKYYVLLCLFFLLLCLYIKSLYCFSLYEFFRYTIPHYVTVWKWLAWKDLTVEIKCIPLKLTRVIWPM